MNVSPEPPWFGIVMLSHASQTPPFGSVSARVQVVSGPGDPLRRTGFAVAIGRPAQVILAGVVSHPCDEKLSRLPIPGGDGVPAVDRSVTLRVGRAEHPSRRPLAVFPQAQANRVRTA